MFLFIREIVRNDSSRILLQEILTWATDFMEYGNRNTIIDVQKLTNEKSPPEHHKRILQELERYVLYKHEETAKKKHHADHHHHHKNRHISKPPPFDTIRKHLEPHMRELLQNFLK